jgi:hypothetical protein
MKIYIFKKNKISLIINIIIMKANLKVAEFLVIDKIIKKSLNIQKISREKKEISKVFHIQLNENEDEVKVE